MLVTLRILTSCRCSATISVYAIVAFCLACETSGSDLYVSKTWQLRVDSGPVLSLDFSPDRQMLAIGTAGVEDRLQLWDLREQKKIVSLEGHLRHVRSVAFSPNGRYLASGGDDGTVRIWNTRNFLHVMTFTEPAGQVWDVKFSPDGKTIAATSEREILLFDLPTRKLLRRLVGHKSNVCKMAFSPDGVSLVSGDRTSNIHVWNPKNGSIVAAQRLDAKSIRLLAFSRGGDRIVTMASRHDGAEVFQIPGLQHLMLIRLPAQGSCVAMSPDFQTLAIGTGEDELAIVDLDSGKEIGRWSRHDRNIDCLVFSADGNMLASGSTDATVRLWDARLWAPVQRRPNDQQ